MPSPLEDPHVRKAITFLSVVFIGLAASLFIGRVTATQTFLADFSGGKEIRTVTDASAVALSMFYRVQPGDTWWKIARDHSVTTRALLDANGANMSTSLDPGDSIHLPGWVPAPASSASASARSKP